MRYFLIPILVLLLSFESFAQNHVLGIKYGKSWMNVNAKDDNFNDSNSRKELTFGVSYEYRIKQNLLLGADLMYLQRGYSLDVLIVDIDGQITGLELEDVVKNHYDYLALPFKGGYVIGKKVEGFINVGLIPSLLISANTYFPESQKYGHNWESSTPYDIKESVSSFDLAALAEVGTNVYLSSRIIVSGSISYQYSLTTISNSQYFDGMGMRNYGFVVVGGLKYKLQVKSKA
jgi:hypothetical protein